MGYSEDPQDVRVDFFKETGKWYATESVRWIHYFSSYNVKGEPQEGGKIIQDAFLEALTKHLTRPDGSIRYAGMWAVCLEPHHEHAHPIMMTVPKKEETHG